MARVSRVKSPVKYHGGKAGLARLIVERMPPHGHYVEPYAGGLSVLLARDPEGVSEVANDLSGDLTNFWRVLQGDDTFAAFHRRAEATPFSEAEWEHAGGLLAAEGGDPVTRAWAFFVHCRQSLAGRMKGFTAVSRRRRRRGMNEQASAWLSTIEGLPTVHGRLKRVLVLCRDAREVLREQDGPDTLFYLDPPYLPETRTAEAVYEHEMTAAEHALLLETVRGLRGKVMLSGYRSALYDEALAGWTLHTFDRANSAAGGAAKRRMTECLWCNF